MLSNENLLKPAFKFYCNNCDYGTCKKSSFNEHLSTMKHKKSIIINENLPFVNENLLKTCSQYICENCNKKYKDNSGLWRHKQKCNKEPVAHEVTVIENNKKEGEYNQLVI